jgi:hypothetical protein
MSNSYEKYLELKEEGAFDFDPTNAQDVLKLAYSKGLRQQVMYDAMDVLRDDTQLTNEQAILKAATRWNLI